MAAIRVVIADDHPPLREGLQRILERAPDVAVVGEAGDGFQALQQARELLPDVLLLDMEMPKMDGVAVAQRVQAERLPVRVLALSAYNDTAFVRGVLAHGAAGYLLKDEMGERITEAIRAVARGGVGWLSPRVAEKLKRTQRVLGSHSLNARQTEILRLLAGGRSNREIASALGIGEKAVEKHLQVIYEQVGVAGRVDAAVWAVRQGLA